MIDNDYFYRHFDQLHSYQILIIYLIICLFVALIYGAVTFNAVFYKNNYTKYISQIIMLTAICHMLLAILVMHDKIRQLDERYNNNVCPNVFVVNYCSNK